MAYYKRRRYNRYSGSRRRTYRRYGGNYRAAAQ